MRTDRWPWLGGRPALDFANTRRDAETLLTAEDLGEWLVAAELLPAPMRVRRAVLDDARALREAIDRGVVALVAGATVPAGALEAIDGWLVHAGTRPRLATGADGLPRLGERPAADSPRRALGTIALDAATLLGVPEQRARIRICAGEGCAMRFYDRSPAGMRRWCSMSRCGNVAKARRHRVRAREAARA